MSLLSQALKIPSNQVRSNTISNDHVELAIAWLEDRVSGKQVTKVLGAKGVPYHKLAAYLRQGFRNGDLKVK